MTTNKKRLDVLLSPAFIAALILLLLNDYFLKYSSPGWITGKLSDFAGLFVYVSFFYAIFPSQVTTTNCATAATFILWKSPYSQPVIDFWNSLGLIEISRVVDYSDLMALLSILAARSYFISYQPVSFKRSIAYPVAAISILAILGTSVPLHTEQRRLQFVDQNRPTLLDVQNAVAKLAVRHNLKCVHCLSSQPYQSYAGPVLFFESNYDEDGGTLYVGISERPAGKPTKITQDFMADLLNTMKLIGPNILVTPYQTTIANHHLRGRVLAANSDWWFPFRIPCLRTPELENILEQVDNFVTAYGFTLGVPGITQGPIAPITAEESSDPVNTQHRLQ